MAKGQYMPTKVRRPIEELVPAARQLETLGFYVAGSYRRNKETVGDLDVVVPHFLDFGEAVETCKTFFQYEESRGGAQKSEGVCMFNRAPLNLNLWRVVHERGLGAMILYTTGPRDLNTMMRAKAQSRGWLLNGNGLFDARSETEGTQLDIGGPRVREHDGIADRFTIEDLEKDIFDKLELQFLTPWEREHWRKYLMPKVKLDFGRTMGIGSSRPSHAPHEVRMEWIDNRWKAVECDCEWFTYNTSKGKKPCQHQGRAEKRALEEWEAPANAS